MNENTVRSSIHTTQRPAADATDLETRSLIAQIAEIAEDALRSPEEYLRDTVVPAGG